MPPAAAGPRTSPEPVAAIVVAAGSGRRLGSTTPKALVEIGGRSLVRHAVEALAAGGVLQAVVVGPADRLEALTAALAGASIDCRVVAGGPRRQDSVARGLEALEGQSPEVILVHDAARPFVPAEVVAGVIAAVRAGAAAVVPVVPVVDTIRQLTTGSSTLLDRSTLRAVQTPQGFDPALLRAAHRELDPGLEFTDDATMCESIGGRVQLVAGSPEAIKITEPFDLVLAGQLWRRRGRESSEGSR